MCVILIQHGLGIYFIILLSLRLEGAPENERLRKDQPLDPIRIVRVILGGVRTFALKSDDERKIFYMTVIHGLQTYDFIYDSVYETSASPLKTRQTTN